MADSIISRMIVEAVAKGFGKVASEYNKIQEAEKQTAKETDKVTEAQKRQAAATARLKQQRQAMAVTSRLAVQRMKEEAERRQKIVDLANKQANVLLALATTGAVAIAATTQLAARVETLGVVIDTLGKNAGYTRQEMRGFEQGLTDQGITLQKARQGLALMVQANLDLTKSLELAKLAQNAAVIAGTDSSEAFQRLVYVISSGNIRMARTMGLQVSFQEAFTRAAEATGKATTELSANEKANIRLQEVLSAGINIQGAYDAAMDTAGKKITSLNRYWEESRRLVGEEYLPTYGRLIDMVTASLKWWTNLEQNQRSVGVSVATSAVAWAGLTGSIMKVMTNMPKMTKAIGTLSGSLSMFLSPAGLAAAAIIAMGAAIIYYNKQIEAQRRANKEFQSGVLDSVDTYEDYIRAQKEYAHQNGIAIMSQEEMNRAQMGARQHFDDTTTSMAEFYAEQERIATAAEDSKTAIIQLDEPLFRLAQHWAKNTDASVAYERALNLQKVAHTKYGERVIAATEEQMAWDQVAEDSVQTIENLTEVTRELNFVMDAMISDALTDYMKGNSEAIRDVLFDMVELQLGTEQFNDINKGILRDIAQDWGMLDQATQESLDSISGWLTEAAETGDWDLFMTRLSGMRQELERVGETGKDSFNEIAEGAELANQSVSSFISANSGRSIGSPMKAFIEDVKWFQAGGYILVEGFEAVKKAVDAGVLSLDKVPEAMSLIVGTYESLGRQLGEQDKAEAISNIAESLDVSEEKAAEFYSTADEIPAALQAISDQTVEYESLVGATDQSQVLLDLLLSLTAKPWIVNVIYKQSGGPPTGGGEGSGEGGTSQLGDEYDYSDFQHGGHFIVPPGYPQDRYKVGLTSGEEVLVVTPGQRQASQINNNFFWSSQMDVHGQDNADYFVDELLNRLEERLRG